MSRIGWSRLRHSGQNFSADESGASLVMFAVFLPALVAMALLAVDVGRYTVLESSLQHGADALALAGAAELDLRPDAIERAERAIANVVTSNKTDSAVTQQFIDENVVTSCYLASLPANDATAISSGSCLPKATSANMTSSSGTARFVQILVSPRNFTTTFPLSFVSAGASNNATAKAEAVAGFQAAVCNFTPLFMCNPFEPTTGVTNIYSDYGFYSMTATRANRRRIYALKDHAANSQWSPGNYGFLQPANGKGANALGDTIAAVKPAACFAIKGLNTQTGNITSMRNAFNTRFDLYGGSYNNPASYPPAQNVRKGYIVLKANGNAGNACNDNNPITTFFSKTPPATYNNAMGLPRDSVIDATTRLGNGDWGGDTASTSNLVPDFEQYWATNFGSTPRPTDELGTQYSNTNLPTRYDIYRYEIDRTPTNLLGFSSGTQAGYPTAGANREKGSPVCNTTPETTVDRRIIYAAVLNCRANSLGNGNSGGPYQALAFAKFFMTEPMDAPPDSTLYTELVDIVRPGRADSIARDMVQLYR